MATIDAPAEAALVVDVVNSVEWQEDTDSWTSPAATTRWFRERLGIRDRFDDATLDRALRLREGLRDLLLVNAGHDPLLAIQEAFARTVAQLPVRLKVDASGAVELAPAGRSADEGLVTVARAVFVSRHDGSWPRLKACSRASCRWAYYDGSRNASARWCSMEGCGNYVKMRRRNNPGADLDDILPPAAGGSRAPRMLDVAARAGVSAKTVSNVLTGAFAVSPGKRARVEAAIRELDYRPNLAARALRTGRPAPEPPGTHAAR